MLNVEQRLDYPLPAHHHPADSAWIQERLAELPSVAHRHLIRVYDYQYRNAKVPQSEARWKANLSLIKASEAAQQLPSFSRHGVDDGAIRHRAGKISENARRTLAALAHDPQAQYAKAQALLSANDLPEDTHFTPEALIQRVQYPSFWRKRLTVLHDRMQEHFMIRIHAVGQHVSPYLSQSAYARVAARLINSKKAMERMEAVCEATDKQLDMTTILESSLSNPRVKLAELRARMQGFEMIADDMGHINVFYTLTCPSKYHSHNVVGNGKGKKGKKTIPNEKYNGATPREAQVYLTTVWSRIRATLSFYDLPIYGLRVVEPHHDGTPHWHLSLFMRPSDRYEITRIMREYALAEDGTEQGAFKNRFTAKVIDKNKGSATGYLFKYLSKNIAGAYVDDDYESGLSAEEGASRVKGWAGTWGIRQFQQIGGAPVTVWRELRRMRSLADMEQHTLPDADGTKPPLPPVLEQAREAADSGDWAGYLKAQGGVLNPRKHQPLKVFRPDDLNQDTGELNVNRYGEIVKRIQGVEVKEQASNDSNAGSAGSAGSASPQSNVIVKTRRYRWKIQLKRELENFKEALQDQQITYKADFDLLKSHATDAESLSPYVASHAQDKSGTASPSSSSSFSSLVFAARENPRSIEINCKLSDYSAYFDPDQYEALQERTAIYLYNRDCEDAIHAQEAKKQANDTTPTPITPANCSQKGELS